MYEDYVRGKIIAKILFFAIVAIFCSSFLIPFKTKSAYTPSISYLEIEAFLQSNGSAVVNETINFEQPSKLSWVINLKNVRHLFITVDGQEIKSKYYRISKKGNYKILTANQKYQGSTWKLAYRSDNVIRVNATEEYLYWPIVSSPGTYINFVTVTLNSPYAFRQSHGYRIYAFHGVSSHSTNTAGSKKIIYYGQGLGANAGFTVYAVWPRNTFKFNILKRTLMDLTSMELIFWIVFGLLLPAFAVIIMVVMFWKKRHQAHYVPSLEKIDHPPSNLSPLVVGILFEMKIYPNIMLSAILDLCERGYLVIVRSKHHYAFGRRKELDDNLRDWEKNLLEELFTAKAIWAKEEDIQKHSKAQLFSPKIREIFDACYENITNLGYFDENPHYVRIKYKLIGIFLYLLSIFGTAWAAFSMQPAYLLLPNIGVFLSAYAIFHLSRYMPIQNQKGFAVVNQWTKFLNFMKDPHPLGASASVGGQFYEYLPYAIAMKAEKKWTKRFRNYRLVMPDWYLSEDFEMTAEQTIPQILSMIDRLSHGLNQLKGPSVN